MSTINPVFTKIYRDKIDGLLTDNLNLGEGAGSINQGADAIAIGTDAGHKDQGIDGIAIGQNAAYEGQGTYGVAIGQAAGAVDQGSQAVAIGHGAASDTQGTRSVACGYFAGNDEQDDYSVAIGFQAGMTTQGVGSVAIGRETAKTNQGDNAVAIGSSAGSATQADGCIAVGYASGLTGQSSKAVAIGYTAGGISQAANSVAIGNTAGYNTQYGSAVAIGDSAGNESQGQYAIAIGSGAGKTSQAQKSIVINASGVDLNNTITGTCKIAPIGSETHTSAQYPLFYNINTKEVCTSDSLFDVTDYIASTSTDLTVVNFRSDINHIRVVFYDLQFLGPSNTTPRIVLGSDSGYWTNTACYDGLIFTSTSGGILARSRFNTSGYIPINTADYTSSDKASFTIDFNRVLYTTILGDLRDMWTVSGKGYINVNGAPANSLSVQFDGQIISPSAYPAERCDRIKIYNTSPSVGGTTWAGGYVAIYYY